MDATSKHCPASEEEPLLLPEQPGVSTQQTGAIPKIKNVSVQKKDNVTGKNKDESGTDIDAKDTMSKDGQKPKPASKIFRYIKSFKVKKIDKTSRNYKIVANDDLVDEDITLNNEISKNVKFCETEHDSSSNKELPNIASSVNLASPDLNRITAEEIVYFEQKPDSSSNKELPNIASSVNLASPDLNRITAEEIVYFEQKPENSSNNKLRKIAKCVNLPSLDSNRATAPEFDYIEQTLAEDLNDCLTFGVLDRGKKYQLRKNVIRNELKTEMNELTGHRNNFCRPGGEYERKVEDLERRRNLLFEPLPPLTELSEEESDFEEKVNATYPLTKSGKLDQFDLSVEYSGYRKVKAGEKPEETQSVNTNVKPVASASLCQRCGETALIDHIKYDLQPSRSGEPIFVDIPLYHYLQICGVFEKVNLDTLKKNVSSKEFNPNPFEIYIGRFLTIRKLCSYSQKTIWIAFDSATCKFVFIEYYLQQDLKVNADELIPIVEITVPSWEFDLKILCEFVTCFNILFDDYILRCIVRSPVDKDIFEEIGHLPASFDKTGFKN